MLPWGADPWDFPVDLDKREYMPRSWRLTGDAEFPPFARSPSDVKAILRARYPNWRVLCRTNNTPQFRYREYIIFNPDDSILMILQFEPSRRQTGGLTAYDMWYRRLPMLHNRGFAISSEYHYNLIELLHGLPGYQEQRITS
jgi:hypothetical protein